MASGSFFVIVFGLAYLAGIVYVLVLGTRFVAAVERIARSMEARIRPEA